MTGGAKSHTNNKPAIKYRYNPHGGAFFDLVDVVPEDYAPTSRDNNKQPGNQSETSSCNIVSTADLVSGVGRLWDFAASSLPVLHHKNTSKQSNETLKNKNTFYYPAEEGKIVASISSTGPNVSVLKTSSHVSPKVKVHTHLDPLHIANKLSYFDSCGQKGISSAIISYELRNMYGWMRDIRLAKPMHTVNPTRVDSDRITRSDLCHNELVENIESLSRENANNMMKTSTDITSVLLDQDVEADNSGSSVPTSILQADSGTQGTSSYPDLQHGKEDQETKIINPEKSGTEICPSTQPKVQYGIAKQEHAFAGAFAGVFVSLCLHPMDTVKTVVQSCHTDQRSIQYIGKSIISERGVSGLYRGIASNIAASAPISAVYTFTYESVKGALLPLFAKEYHPVVHCVAGGCASVATSFIFTPSERIKQQMQVGSHYHSCWNALFGIVGKGGFSSLYNGWGAVLCRNVPHSIIKFYTYESLKKVMFSLQSDADLTTITTLLCGGVAGSTAALFTTPFDVVKTRLQTQIPGSIDRYHGVFNTLKEIAKHEGLKGLYRGLTPRLAMYMTQGALFFASYESLKRLFSTEKSSVT